MTFDNSADGPEAWWWLLFFLWTVIWLLVLRDILTCANFDSVTKLLWVVVVIFVPFFGVFLYWFLAPSEPTEKRDPVNLQSDVSGTPWEKNASFTKDK